MRISHLAHSNRIGGAANYMNRVLKSLEVVEIENELLVSSLKPDGDENNLILGFGNQKINYIKAKISQTLDRNIRLVEKTARYSYKSPNLIGAIKAKNLNSNDSDIIHLHWINGGLISIKQIGKITKPIVWTMLDMWPFMGGEHYPLSESNLRYIEGYSKLNRPKGDIGIDLCKITWDLKKTHYKKFNLISPSSWLANEASKSYLFKNSQIEVIPPPIDTKIFSPVSKNLARKKINLDYNKFVIGFVGGISSRKGWDHINSICSYPILNSKWHFLLGGAEEVLYTKFKNLNGRATIIGKIKNSQELVYFYSSLDILLVPSIEEAFGLVAQEAQACGVPVIVFDETGVTDTIINKKTGFIVKKNSTDGILKTLDIFYNSSAVRKSNMSRDARERAKKEWNEKVIGDKHKLLYNTVLKNR
jgi:glycosyltransferase involved in cell wall biosynthesis